MPHASDSSPNRHDPGESPGVPARPDALARITDANANRAREALRTLEDLARFGLDDAALAGDCKTARHGLRGVLEALPLDAAQLLAARDTPGDTGTTIKAAGEFDRHNLADIARAAAGRLTEALRCLEEAAKGLGQPAAAAAAERTRYLSYELERRLVLALGSGCSRQWRLCVLITEALCTHHRWDVVAHAAIEGGADCLQLREKSLEGAEFVRRTTRLREIAAGRAAVIVNDRVDVALAAGADGVHVGQLDLRVSDVRRLAGSRLLVGISTATLDQARQAARDGADYCGLGPMFPSSTKPKDQLAGLAYLRAYLAEPLTARVPHLAISGITAANTPDLVRAGARGVAVSSAVCSATDPKAAAQAIVAAMTAQK